MIQLSDTHLKIVKELLATHIPNCEVRAFGSRVKGTDKQYADPIWS